MKFLMVSMCGEGAQVLKKIELEGNKVGLFVVNNCYKNVWRGLLPHVEIDSFIDRDTIVLFDFTGNGKIADDLKKKGHLVYGGSSFADKLEEDRDFGLDSMRKCGIKVPDTKSFTDFKSGIDYITSNKDKRFVFKPSGEMPCKLTYVPEDSNDLTNYLKFVESKFAKDIKKFDLQEFVEGDTVSTEFFCNGKKFISPANHTVEVKKFMNDNLGPSTGCSGNIVWLADDDDFICSDGVKKVEKFCVDNGFIGQIDLNSVVNDDGVWGLEWTPRFGYDATPSLLSIVDCELGKFFSDITRGETNELKLKDCFASGIRLTIPPYPIEPKDGDAEEVSPNIGVPINGWEDFQENCYFYEVMLDGNNLVHSGGTGVIMCAVGVGDDPHLSLDDPYEIVQELNVPDKQYRTDLQSILPQMYEGAMEYANARE